MPSVGKVPWGRQRRLREQIEDALKYVHKSEIEGQTPSVESLAGALDLRVSDVLQVVEEMQKQGLLEASGSVLRLSPEGRELALQRIRAHRIWERYLVDKGGLSWADVHAAADRREHDMTVEEADALEAEMGFPPQDPHGDLIPHRQEPLPADPGTPLAEWPPGQVCQIVHVEDEPKKLFDQVIAVGLLPGLVLRVKERSPQVIRLEFDGEEVSISPLLARAVTVGPLQPDQSDLAASCRLSALKVGEAGVVVRLECEGMERWRLEDLGLLPGTRIVAEMASPFGDPVAYRVRDSLIALRKEQADRIRVLAGPSEGGTE